MVAEEGALAEWTCPRSGQATPLIPPDALAPWLRHLDPAWGVDPSGREIARTFRFSGFDATMRFLNAVAELAREQDHHPRLEVGYDDCRVRYTTHAVGGLTRNDLICAAKLDRLARGDPELRPAMDPVQR